MPVENPHVSDGQSPGPGSEPAEDKDKGHKSGRYWSAQLAAARKELRLLHEQGRRVTKLYLNQGSLTETTGMHGDDDMMSTFNLYHANVQTLMSVLYARAPKPYVDRAFEDFEDDVARVGGEILQRLLVVKARSSFDEALRQAVFDRLVPGLGQIWFGYTADIEECHMDAITMEDGREIMPAFDYERVAREDVCVDYVYWEDFLYSPARTWDEVWWVARDLYMIKDDVVAQFGKKASQNVSYTHKRNRMPQAGGDPMTPQHDQQRYGLITEIWCKHDKKAYYVSSNNLLDVKDDPLQLEGFFPCPKPLLAINTNSRLTPVSDYSIARAQYQELELVNSRIYLLVDACRVSGVYDKNNAELKQMLQAGLTNNQMIPVDNWAMFAEKGGIKGAVDWFPLEMVINTLDKLRQYRTDLVQQLYEVTGIADIVRGASKASETLGAQQLKAQYAGMRLQNMQLGIASFVECACEIMAQIMVKHFDPETLVKRTNLENTPDRALIEPAIELLRTDMGKYRIIVTSDQMAVPDFMTERDERVTFIRAFSEFLKNMAPAVQMVPGSAPFMLQILQWSAAGFRSSRTIESVLDGAVKAANKALEQQQSQPPQPSPEEQKAKAEMQKMQAELQMDQQKMQMEAQAKQQETQASLQAEQMKTQANIASTQAKTDAQVQAIQAKTAAQIAADQQKRQADAIQSTQDMRQNAMEHRQKMVLDAQTAQARAAAAKTKSKTPKKGK